MVATHFFKFQTHFYYHFWIAILVVILVATPYEKRYGPNKSFSPIRLEPGALYPLLCLERVQIGLGRGAYSKKKVVHIFQSHSPRQIPL